jgi:transcriptional regulator with GAF, ATPase, and Fis domain
MARESDIVESLVEMADTLVDDYDVVDVLTVLADRCVHLLGVAAAGVMLASPEGDLRLVASSSEAMRVLEVFELQAQEGPCLDAFRTGERVEHEHLRPGAGRWPRFATAALDAGFKSAFALPLRLRNMTIGAMNLFHAEQTPMDERDVIVARAFADLATITVLQHRAAAESPSATWFRSAVRCGPATDPPSTDASFAARASPSTSHSTTRCPSSSPPGDPGC